MVHKKLNLPEKICLHCLRPYAWRKKWQHCWQDVKYCSEGCRRSAKRTKNAAPANMCFAGQVDDEF